MEKEEVVIIGGGLAGLTAGIHLAKSGVPILLLEKGSFPRHKVCGEYVSREVEPYLEHLGIDIGQLQPKTINKFLFSSSKGETVETELQPGGWGLSRYAFDHHLYQVARECGVRVKTAMVNSVSYIEGQFLIGTLKGSKYRAAVVLGAFGKRSKLDSNLDRPFFDKNAPWIALKEHYQHPDFPEDLVALHHFNGGYCGLSRIESGAVNLCYLTTADSFKSRGGAEHFTSEVLSQNPKLNAFLSAASPLFKKPLSIAQVSFQTKSPVKNHVLMLGDAAGLLHPLCGNGMAMAIGSAKLASELILKRLENRLTQEELEHGYKRKWNKQFKNRIRTGRLLQGLLLNKGASKLALPLMRIPGLLPKIIGATHGPAML